MAKIKFNVKGVESGGGQRKLVKPGVYDCKITSCVDATPTNGKDRRLEVVSTITQKGDFEGVPLRTDYINLVSEAAAWKLRQFLEGVGIVKDGKESGDFDPAKLVNKPVRIRVKSRMDEEYGAQNEVGTYLPVEDEEDLEEGEDLTEEESDADEAVEGEGEGEDSELWNEEELTELDDDDLIAVAAGDPDDEEDEGFDIDLDDFTKIVGKGKKAKTKLDRDGLIAAILEAQGGEEEEGEEEGGEESEEEEGEDGPDYDSMTDEDLRAACKERGLVAKGKRDVLIKRLRKDDEPF